MAKLPLRGPTSLPHLGRGSSIWTWKETTSRFEQSAIGGANFRPSALAVRTLQSECCTALKEVCSVFGHTRCLCPMAEESHFADTAGIGRRLTLILPLTSSREATGGIQDVRALSKAHPVRGRG
jgi:hypothetical protein